MVNWHNKAMQVLKKTMIEYWTDATLKPPLTAMKSATPLTSAVELQ